jgi:transposase
VGRSRGGLTTKIHLLADEQGLPVDFAVTAGQVNDCTQALALLGERKVSHVLADKGYDTDVIIEHVAAMACDQVQGFLLARPLNTMDFEDLLRTH